MRAPWPITRFNGSPSNLEAHEIPVAEYHLMLQADELREPDRVAKATLSQLDAVAAAAELLRE